MTIPKANQQAALISAASITLASMTLLSVRAMHPTWLSDQLDALLLSLACGVGVCFLLVAPRFGQAHLALGGYLLAIGAAAMILPPLLVVGMGKTIPMRCCCSLAPSRCSWGWYWSPSVCSTAGSG